MRNFTAVVEKCPDTGLYVGYVPGFPGAHSQGETLDEPIAIFARSLKCSLKKANPGLKLNLSAPSR